MADSPGTTDVHAMVVQAHGGPDFLTAQDVRLKAPGPGEVQVRLAVAGINFVDIYMRRGLKPVPLPYTPGLDGTGVVEAVGPGVSNVRPGDHVAYADATLVPADSLIPLPDDVSFEQGAAFPLQGMTAHYLIHEFRKPSIGDVVLVHAAAGGVDCSWCSGPATSAPAPSEPCPPRRRRRRSAKRAPTTSSSTPSGTSPKRPCATHRDLRRGRRRCRTISPNVLMERSLSLSGGDLWHFMRTHEEMLHRADAVMEGIENGWLTPRIFRVLPMADVAEAHRLLEDRKTIGKILLASGD
nr:alcohol dehydrogenase catalytic domain-containing protein [Streptomyces sp. FT05W]